MLRKAPVVHVDWSVILEFGRDIALLPCYRKYGFPFWLRDLAPWPARRVRTRDGLMPWKPMRRSFGPSDCKGFDADA
jgi:hypothetical protein